MKFFAILLVTLFSFKSCLTDSTTINVVMNDAGGLKEGSKVKCKGLDVGKVNDIKIVGDKVIASIKLNEDFQITKGSTAQVNIENIFNSRNLTILPSASNEILVSGDTIYAQNQNNLDFINSILNGNKIDSVFSNLNLDSLDIKIVGDSVKFKKLMEEASKILDLKKIIN